MKTIIPILTLLVLAIPVQATSTARQLQLLDMRTRELKPYNGPDRPVPSRGIGHFKYVKPRYSAREQRQDRRYRQNSHRRQWQQQRQQHRFYRSRFR